jgi:Na+-driven multidrug efflux pump
VAAALTGLAVGAAMLRRTELWQPRAARTWRPDAVAGLRRIGLPIAASFLLIAGYNFAVIGVLGQYGSEAVAGFTVAASLQNFVMLPATVLGTVTAIAINQQRGAGEWHRIPASLRGGLEVAVALYAVLALLVWSLAGPVARLLSADHGVATSATGYLGAVALTFVVQGPVLASLTVMEETGGGTRAIVLNSVYFALIVVAGALAAHAAGNADAFYRAVALCNLIGVTVPVVAVRYVRRMALSGPDRRPAAVL